MRTRFVRMMPVLALMLLAPMRSAAAVDPRTTFSRLVSTNGFAPLVYDIETRRVTSFREHLYRYPAPGETTRELAFDLYLGLRVAGRSRWLTDVPLLEAGYEPGTGIIRTVAEDRGLRVTTRYFAPFDLDRPAFVVVVEIENIGADAEDVAILSLHNFHLGGGTDGTGGERIRYDRALGASIESSERKDGARGVLVVKPLVPATRHTTSPENPFSLVAAGRRFPDVDDSGVRDDAVGGFELQVREGGHLPAGARAELGLVIGYAPDRDAAGIVAAIETWAAQRSMSALIEAERAGWDAWHGAGRRLETQSPEESALARQSLALLRMAEVREPGAANGGIVASLPPGHWDITWLRDGMLAVQALARTGHTPEAKAALEHVMRGPVGEYAAYVGRPYGLSVARYFGNAREESDWNERGPNVELDGFGMFLEAFAATVREGRDTAFYRRHRGAIDEKIADVLATFRDPETALIAADSSIWESHWDNGGRQRWAYTSGTAVRGLDAWASLIAELDGPSDPKAAAYHDTADAIHAAMLRHLVAPSGALAASVEQLRRGRDFADAQVAFLLEAPRFPPTSKIGRATLDLLKQSLFLVATTGRGYRRNDDGDLYDRREWIVIDLALARALERAGETQDARALLDWVTQLGARNHGLIPELLDEVDARYAGETPMIGFGAGAYVLALVDRAEAEAKPAEGVDAGTTQDATDIAPHDASAASDAASAGAAPPEADAATRVDTESDARGTRQREGCGCASTQGSGASALVLGLALAALVRRRRRRPW